MSLDPNMFSPSLLHSINDYVLHLALIMMVCKFYLESDDKPRDDFMISPLHTPPEILTRFPRSILLICEYDPLHDDNIRFFLKML